ncbi:hypothetical protein PTSG_03259 [Salpingoeca rosetta]|uniref:EF-hand domain-containing protein n=1 Tax=Salpingoeca rosetta (strain ATCC 50818 / BSB-021) TaxID=946362 RepID=F2U4N9_SALR5|nr:uncharacterized protein PTSG_03259 [Salpingoeca rosetta]EGD82605.1 hypothetical protein PTSG_03259 [Salpingoeca rosetta]|eukprot:XP_004995841.1 hypothetical protein PTSG_03259 [Salpingoeca rosetta]
MLGSRFRGSGLLQPPDDDATAEEDAPDSTPERPLQQQEGQQQQQQQQHSPSEKLQQNKKVQDPNQESPPHGQDDVPGNRRRKRQLPSIHDSLARSSQQELETTKTNDAMLKRKATRAMFSHAVTGTGMSQGINVTGVKALISQLLSPTDDMHPHGVFAPRHVTTDHAKRVLDILDFDQDGVWSWDEFQRACELLLDSTGNPSSYRRSILMADDIVLQHTVREKEDEIQELTDRIEAMHKEYEDVIEDLRQRLHEREAEKHTIIDQANDDIGALQKQLRVLRQQLVRARSRQGSGGDNDNDNKDGGEGGADDDGTAFTPAPLRRRPRLQPTPPTPRLSVREARRREECADRSPSETSSVRSTAHTATTDALTAEVRHLRAKLADRNERMLALKDELAEASEVIVEFSDRISRKDQELFALQRQNVELQSQLDEYHVQGLIQHRAARNISGVRQPCPETTILSSPTL